MRRNTANLLKTTCLASAVALSGAIIVAPATAQDSEVDADAERTLDVVTVQTTRREESLQEVPVAVTAITEDVIDAVKPRNISDLTGFAPNTFIGQTTAVTGGGAIFIRGLGYADVEKTQNPAAGVSLDGLFLGTNTGQLIDAFDIEQVEVGRGPQGVFSGKNTTAGVVAVTRTKPTREYGFRGSAAYGSNEEIILKGIANTPLGENGGLKLGGSYRETDGFTENLLTGDTIDGFEYWSLSAAIDYDLTETFNAKFIIDHFNHEGGGLPIQYGNLLAVGFFQGLGVDLTQVPGYNAQTGSPAGLGPREVINDFTDMDELTTTIVNGTLTWETPIGEIVSVTGYLDSEDLFLQDFDGTCSSLPDCPPTASNPLVPLLHTRRDSSVEQFTQEVRLAGDAGPIGYLAGIYYYDATITLDQDSNGVIFQFSEETNESTAIFGNLDWRITDTVTISAGARYIDESKELTKEFNVLTPGGLLPLIPGFTQPADFEDTITRVAVDWQAHPNHLLYTSRSEGFRSGGLSIRGTLSEQIEGQINCVPDNGNGIPGELLCPENNFLTYDPETVTAWELGTKNLFGDGQFIFNAAYFMTEVEDFQVGDVVVTPGYGPGTNTYINNYPEVEIEGLEFEAVYAPTQIDGLVLSANVGIQDGEITDGTTSGARVGISAGGQPGPRGSSINRAGVALVRVPDYNYAMRGLYTFDAGPGEVTLSAGYNYIDDHSLAGGFGGADIQPGYGLIDASIQYDWDRYSVSLSGRNLGDEDYRLNSLPTVFFQRWADDVNWLLEFQAKF